MSNITLASGYYLKALDNFHYAADEALEQLNYALSYDEEYAPAHCLMGALCMKYFKDYKAAKHCFERALLYDLSFIDTYKWYITLCLWTSDVDRADRLIERASSISAFPKWMVYQYKMQLAEIRGNMVEAIKMTDFGSRVSMCEITTEFFSSHAKRLKAKLPRKKNNQSKKKRKKN